MQTGDKTCTFSKAQQDDSQDVINPKRDNLSFAGNSKTGSARKPLEDDIISFNSPEPESRSQQSQVDTGVEFTMEPIQKLVGKDNKRTKEQYYSSPFVFQSSRQKKKQEFK